MTDLTTPRAPQRPHPVPAPRDELPGEVERPGGVDVELTRLLALVRLTGPQALVLAGQLAAALAGRAEGAGSEPVRPLLAADGGIVLTPAPDGSAGEPVDRILAGLAATAGHPVGSPSPAARDVLTEAAARVDGPAVRAELAVLVRAVRALPDGIGGAGAPPAAPSRRPDRSTPGPRPPRRRRSTGRRVGAWLLSLVVLGAVVTAEVVFLGDDITKDIDLLLDAGRGEEEPADEPEPDGLPVTAPAPASAGNVVSVDLRPLAGCTPGAPCSVRLLVRLLPSPEPQVLTWSYRVVDRCTGASTSVPGGSVPVPPQADRVALVTEVLLPPLAGVALIAVTEAPATAASVPLSAGSCRPAGPDA